jgi:HSP20 family protein
MAQVRGTHLRRLHGQFYQQIRVEFSQSYPSHAWNPDINAYLCAGQIIICVDLAGVEAAGVDVRVESRRVQLRGHREAPEPRGPKERPLQTLAMEIDYGPFEREITLPVEVDTGRVTADQRNGLLWIYLPMRSEASV